MSNLFSPSCCSTTRFIMDFYFIYFFRSTRTQCRNDAGYIVVKLWLPGSCAVRCCFGPHPAEPRLDSPDLDDDPISVRSYLLCQPAGPNAAPTRSTYFILERCESQFKISLSQTTLMLVYVRRDSVSDERFSSFIFFCLCFN